MREVSRIHLQDSPGTLPVDELRLPATRVEVPLTKGAVTVGYWRRMGIWRASPSWTSRQATARAEVFFLEKSMLDIWKRQR